MAYRIGALSLVSVIRVIRTVEDSLVREIYPIRCDGSKKRRKMCATDDHRVARLSSRVLTWGTWSGKIFFSTHRQRSKSPFWTTTRGPTIQVPISSWDFPFEFYSLFGVLEGRIKSDPSKLSFLNRATFLSAIPFAFRVCRPKELFPLTRGYTCTVRSIVRSNIFEIISKLGTMLLQ